MRVLVSSTEGAGHFGPLTPVVEAAARRGDDVLFVVPPGLAARAEATGHPVRVGADPPAAAMAAIWDRVRRSPRGEASVLINREFFGRLGPAAMLPAVGAACDEWQPDLILREAAEYAAAIAAERRGLPHAQVAIGLAEVESSSLALAAPALEDHGGQIVPRLLAAPYLTRLPASLDPSPFTTTLRFRERAGPPPSPLPDWWDGDQSPLVFVSFGTIAGRLPAGVAAYQAVVTAVTGLPVRVLLTTGRTREAAELGPVPRNVHVEAWVPQQDVLPHASVAVIHGGAGTTFGALAAGVPLVVVPMMADQPANARLVAGAGAGLAVEPDFAPAPAPAGPAPAAPAGPAGPGRPAGNRQAGPQIRAAVETVLADASYRQSAERIAAEMRAAPAIDQVLGTLAASLR